MPGTEKRLIPIYEDNEACIAQIQKEFIRTDANKHIDPKFRAWVSQANGDMDIVDVRPIPSQENTADIFTKALNREMHWHHVKGLGMMSRMEAEQYRLSES